MKWKILIVHFYLFILKILKNSNCKEILGYECENNSNYLKNEISSSYLSSTFSYFNNNKLNSRMYFDIEEKIITLNPGEVQSIALFKDKIYILDFNTSNYNNENMLLVQFYPLDCQIKIFGENINSKKELTIEKTSNYENYVFYTLIKKDELSNTNIKIKTLIDSIKENDKNRTFHLIINSLEYINNTNLIIKEKEPILLNFNNSLFKVNLLYYLNKEEKYFYPISISFFIKERMKLKISVSYNENKLIEKNIYYTDRILIDRNLIPKDDSYLKISISIRKNDRKDNAIMIAKIIGDYLTPIYFQKNILNIGFIPSNVSYQYYYMEIFKGEEGEITLNNKRYNGNLLSKLISKKEINENDILYSNKYYPKDEKEKDNLLEFNKYSQKIYFNTDKTNICIDGCYLLLTYYSIYFNERNNSNIKGTEFTLVGRILDEEEDLRSQIVNIPLNEYLFGSFEYSSIKIHYYSLYIPEKDKNFILEINVNNIGIFLKGGVKKFNIFSLQTITKKYFGDIIYEINPHDFQLDSFGEQYITFALCGYLPIENSHYYFRILQQNSNNNYLIYPLDTNKVNLCNTSRINARINGIYSCFFYIDNIYRDLYNDLIIYAYGAQKVNYEVYFADDNDDYYSINLNNLNYKNITKEDNNIFLKIDNKDYVNSTYILVNIQSYYEETLTVLSNFYDNLPFSPCIQIYSYQLIYLTNYINFKFDLNFQNQYRFLMNNTYGNGNIIFRANSIYLNTPNILISGKKVFSFVITKDKFIFDVFNNNKNDNDPLLFNIKVVNELNNQIFEELYFNYDYKNMIKSFPKKYFLKDMENEGADINFYFDFKNLNKTINKDDLIIRGYILKYDDLMNLITDFSFIQFDFGEEIKGRFDNRTNTGLIVFDIKNLKDNSYQLDYYYLIEINSKKISNITTRIYVTSKNDSLFSIPINKYISGSFDLTNDKNQTQRYYINGVQNSSSSDFIIEFSSNYKYIGLIFSNSIKKNSEKRIGGIQRYFVTIDQTITNQKYLDIILNKIIPNKDKGHNYCKAANYIIRYYQSNEAKINYTVNLHGRIIEKNNSKILTIKNNNKGENIKGNFTITCIFNLYEKERILKDELINTIAPTDSEQIYLNTTKFYQKPFNETSFPLNNLVTNEEYKGTVFTILQSNVNEEIKSYYLFTFDISEKSKKSYRTINIIIGCGVAFVIMIIIITIITIITIKFKKERHEKKDLKEKEKDLLKNIK